MNHILTLLLFLSIAQFASAEVGFHPLDSANAPRDVRPEGKKTLEVWAPMIMEAVPTSKLAETESSLRTTRVANFRDQIRRQFNQREINDCRQRQTSTCMLSKQVGRGTGFIVNGNTLVTVKHNFTLYNYGLTGRINYLAEDWNRLLKSPSTREFAKREMEAFRQDPMRQASFILTDSRGRVVFNSWENTPSFVRYGNLQSFEGSIAFDHVGNISATLLGEDEAEQEEKMITNDIAVVRLPVNLPSNRLAVSECEPGKSSFTVGYPSTTESRKQYGARDALDRELTVARGHFLNDAETRVRGSNWRHIDGWVQAMKGFPVWFSGGDSTPGLSGAPIFNAHGEVCGVVNGSLPMSEEFTFDSSINDYRRFSYGRTVRDLGLKPPRSGGTDAPQVAR